MKKSNSLNVMAGLFVICGIILLLGTLGIGTKSYLLWPVLVFILGAGFLALNKHNKVKDSALVTIGTSLILLSTFFYYLNFTSWVSLAYLWPVFLVILGVSFMIAYFTGKRIVLLWVGAGSILAGLTFIFIFSVSAKFWPIALIMAGIFLYIISPSKKRKRKRK